MWGTVEDTAFNDMKCQFDTADILRHFDNRLPIILETDASDFAIAAADCCYWPFLSTHIWHSSIPHATATIFWVSSHRSQARGGSWSIGKLVQERRGSLGKGEEDYKWLLSGHHRHRTKSESDELSGRLLIL